LQPLFCYDINKFELKMTKVGIHEWTKRAKYWNEACTLWYIADARDVTPDLEHPRIHLWYGQSFSKAARRLGQPFCIFLGQLFYDLV